MKKYIKRPIEVEAFQSGVDDIPNWAIGKIYVRHDSTTGKNLFFNTNIRRRNVFCCW